MIIYMYLLFFVLFFFQMSVIGPGLLWLLELSILVIRSSSLLPGFLGKSYELCIDAQVFLMSCFSCVHPQASGESNHAETKIRAY